MATVAASVALAQESNAGDVDDQAAARAGAQDASYEDVPLAAALRSAGLLDDWISAGSVAPESALILVDGSPNYLSQRDQFMEDLRAYEIVAGAARSRAERLDSLESTTAEIDNMMGVLRQDIVSNTVSIITPSDSVVLLEAGVSPAGESSNERRRGWTGFTFDPTAVGERRLVAVIADLQAITDDVEESGSPVGGDGNAMADALTELAVHVEDLRMLSSLGRQTALVEQLTAEAQRSQLLAAMPDLHAQRLMAPTSVEGLPLVTVDAYVRGAATLDPACPVRWNLLAGIGRVESFHGTIGGSTVQSNGGVTEPILGPLLDGGATEREAAEAAEIEAALLAVEAEVEADAIAEAEAAFDRAIWGSDPLDQAEEDEEESAQGDETSGFGSAPWNAERLSKDDGSQAPQETEEQDQKLDPDDEEALLGSKGNGFAVIEDTDEGLLDGNADWDRAVGPMQFIPETWTYWETDGNADGVMNPQNLYDSAASAGRFLCHLSRTRGESPAIFVLGYNSSKTYVDNVMTFADAYGAKALPKLD